MVVCDEKSVDHKGYKFHPQGTKNVMRYMHIRPIVIEVYHS